MMVFTSSLNVLDQRLVERVAAALLTSPGLVEKDWHVTRALAVLVGHDHGGAKPAFGGGTSLSKGWGLIKRFSEDIDFKVAVPEATSRNKAKNERSAYRKSIVSALTEAGFVLAGEPTRADENHFFSADLFYPNLFDTSPGLRPHIRVEMTLRAPALPPIARPIASLIALSQREPPEVAAFLCVDPVETAADKLSALAWRVLARRRGSDGDDPTIIRHLHDLAALKQTIATSGEFSRLALKALADDTGRGGEATASSDPAALAAGMIDRLTADPLWATEYQDYVNRVSFARPDEQLGFDAALSAVRDLVALVGEGV
jgi:predicted nucleotidyltransferase component of viral defense system